MQPSGLAGRAPRGLLERNTPGQLLAEQLFSRSAGALLVEGNAVDLLIDGRANFDAWLEAIRGAKSSILLENYILDDDEVLRAFRDALIERAEAGVRVCLIRDWFGCLGASRDSYWDPLRRAGGEVRTYNPFRVSSPFGWLSRNHRKLLVVDSEVAFISGVCLSARWLGDAERGVEPWRDTGVAVRGPALRDVAIAFADNWARLGPPLDDDLPALRVTPPVAGNVALRVVATTPNSSGVYRLEYLIAAMAQKSVWLTDAYFVAHPPFVQALSAAARDGVDVRLLVPGTSDVPAVGMLSRAGYRPLLEAGVRLFEWNGTMVHAKTAVADGRWARVGSSNLNLASWMGNCELDLAIEDEDFAAAMQDQYEADLENATEVLLGPRPRRRRSPGPRRGAAGSLPMGRATAQRSRRAAGALRLANTVGAAITSRRVLGPAEGGVLLGGALLLAGIGVVALLWPAALAYPLAVIALWSALSLTGKYVALRRRAREAEVPKR